MTFQPPAPWLGGRLLRSLRAASLSWPARPPSSPDRRSCEAAALTCPRTGPAPPWLPGSRSRGRRPPARCRPKLPSSPSHRLLGRSSRCAGLGALRGRRASAVSSSRFAPQTVVAATRAPHLFYRRPQPFRRRAGASAGEVLRRGARGVGELQQSKGGGAPAGLRPDQPAEKAECSRKQPKQRSWARAEPRELSERESSAPHPSAPGNPSRTAAKGGAGAVAAVCLGMLRVLTGKTPCPKG
nr:uncharacterized protein LOC118970404 [Manis javanica]